MAFKVLLDLSSFGPSSQEELEDDIVMVIEVSMLTFTRKVQTNVNKTN